MELINTKRRQTWKDVGATKRKGREKKIKIYDEEEKRVKTLDVPKLYFFEQTNKKEAGSKKTSAKKNM